MNRCCTYILTGSGLDDAHDDFLKDSFSVAVIARWFNVGTIGEAFTGVEALEFAIAYPGVLLGVYQ